MSHFYASLLPNLKIPLFSGRALSDSRIPIGYGRLFFSKYVYPFRTEPQAAANEKEKFWPRGKFRDCLKHLGANP